MADVLKGTAARVSVAQKTAELRMTRLNDSVTVHWVVAADIESSGCRVDKVHVGMLTIIPHGLGSVRLRCPLTTAQKIAADDRLSVGWSARVHSLQTRRLQCFRY
jgi:hypothetical protein